MTTVQKYVFNGVTYNNLDEMPPEVRQFFKDDNQNGIPDFAENKNAATLDLSGIFSNPLVQKALKKLEGVSGIPEDKKALLTQSLEKLMKISGQTGNVNVQTFTTSAQQIDQVQGLSDDVKQAIKQSLSTLSAQPSVSASSQPYFSSSQNQFYNPAVKSSSSKIFILLIVAIGLFLILGAAAFLIFRSGLK
ncbi:MAG: hypothetical protein U1F57_11230 [bacterium]